MRFLLIFPLLIRSASAQTPRAAATPAWTTVITRVGSPTDLSVEGVPVAFAPGVLAQPVPGAAGPYVGQTAELWGEMRKDGTALEVRQMRLLAPAGRHVNGSGLIERLETAPAGTHRFRADGRLFELDDALFGKGEPMTAMGGKPVDGEPAQFSKASLDDVQVNHWVDYSGEQRADGFVHVDYVEFAANTVKGSEVKLRQHEEWDASSVSEDNRQGTVSKFLIGTDLHRIPPYHDPEMQARVTRIGESLVPAYQRALPDDDPVKIRFQFQLVDEAKWGDCITSPGGVILVPYELVERLRNDSQVAALLADNIATALEKQTYRARSKQTALAVTQAAAGATLLLAPVTSVAAMLGTAGGHKLMMNGQHEQSGRVALGLMHDAGYDVREAPETWWILATHHDADPHRKPPPLRARNQLEALGSTWQGERQLPAGTAEAKR